MQGCDIRIILLHAPSRRRGGRRSPSAWIFSNVGSINRAKDYANPVVVCNDSLKCVFVRVVDSCAGCPKGSKHVDLTRAAFSRLADLNMGVLQVQMRRATGPPESEW